ncbi:hypothetical protein VNO78_18311 [Psophocarpus tetragonolobus]|uniref:Uncharacterized protein n=1 Tax=Psophocarpus tetragonolobus TaxID=3891 RepID=A0AAN9SKC3_PSOTE
MNGVARGFKFIAIKSRWEMARRRETKRNPSVQLIEDNETHSLSSSLIRSFSNPRNSPTRDSQPLQSLRSSKFLRNLRLGRLCGFHIWCSSSILHP